MNKLKYIFLLLLLGVTAICYPQSIQRGKVFEQNSGFKPLAGVQIDVQDATPKVSDINGCFQLEFSNKKNGQILFVNSISKSDYLVINQKSIDQWSLSTGTEFKVIMSLKSLYQQNIKNYYKIGYSRYKERYETILHQLKVERQKDILNEKEYKIALDSVKNEYKKELSSLDYYIDIFARINKDDLKGVDSVAMSLLDRNQLDSAIVVYERERYYEKFCKQLKATKELDIEIKSMIPSLHNYADMCAFAGGKDNYQKVGRILETIAISDTTNYDYTFDYLKYLQQQKQYKKGVIWGERALRISQDNEKRNAVLIILGECYTNTLDLHKVVETNKKYKEILDSFELDNKALRSLYNQAISIATIASEYENMIDENMWQIMVDKGITLIRLLKKVKSYFTENEINLNDFFKSTYSNIFPLMISANRYKEVEYYSQILLDIYNVMNHQSKQYIKEETQLLGRLIEAEVELAKGNNELAKAKYENLYSQFNKLYRNNPESFAYCYIQYLYYTVKCFHQLKLNDEALEKANEASNIIEDVDLSQSLNISAIYTNLITIVQTIYRDRNMLEEQEQGYNKMMKVYDIFKNKDENLNEAIMPELCSMVINLADIKIKLSKSDEAKIILQTVLSETKESKNNETSNFQQLLLNNKLGDIYLLEKNDSAKIYYEEALAICKNLIRVNRSENIQYKIWTLNSLGNFYRENLHDYKHALELYNEGLKLCCEVNNQDKIFYLADGESAIGNTYELLGNEDKSKEHFQKSLEYNRQGLEIRKKTPGIKYPDILKSYGTIGYILSMNLKDYPGAIKNYLQAIPILKDMQGENCVEMADLCNIIGNMYFELKEFDKAIEYYSKTLEIGTLLFGYNHSGTANIYNRIGESYYNQGDYANALKNLNHAKVIRENILENEDSTIIETYYNIGQVYIAQNNYSEALKYFKSALSKEEKKYGIGHVNTADLNNWVGKTYYALEDYPAALDYITQASVIWEKENGEKNNTVAEAYYNIGTINSFLKEYKAAVKSTTEAMNIYKMLAQEDTQFESYVAQAMGSISYNEILCSNFKEAEQYARDALKIAPSQTWIKTNLIAAFIFEGKNNEAEQIIKELINIKSEDGRGFDKIILEDLDTFEKAGIIPEITFSEVEKIRKILKGN